MKIVLSLNQGFPANPNNAGCSVTVNYPPKLFLHNPLRGSYLVPYAHSLATDWLLLTQIKLRRKSDLSHYYINRIKSIKVIVFKKSYLNSESM